MKSENPFGSNSTRLSKEKLAEFDNKRFLTGELNSYKDWQYNPLSTTHGNFFKKKPNLSLKRVLSNHEFTGKLKESGYSINHFTFDRTGWIPDICLNEHEKNRIPYSI